MAAAVRRPFWLWFLVKSGIVSAVSGVKIRGYSGDSEHRGDGAFVVIEIVPYRLLGLFDNTARAARVKAPRPGGRGRVER